MKAEKENHIPLISRSNEFA